MRRRWRWFFWPLVILTFGGLTAWYIIKDILPYSTLYNKSAKLSTTPNGINLNAKQSTQVSQPVPAAVRLTIITGQLTAGQSLEQGASIRIDVVDARHNVIKDGSATTITLSSSSAAGKFDTGIAAFLPDGRLSKVIHYTDTLAGAAQISAFVSGLTGSTVTIQVAAAAPVGVTDIAPAWRQPPVGQTTIYGVSLVDAYGNLCGSGTVHWTVTGPHSGSAGSGTDVEVASDGISHFAYQPDATAAGSSQELTASFGGVTKQLALIPAAQ